MSLTPQGFFPRLLFLLAILALYLQLAVGFPYSAFVAVGFLLAVPGIFSRTDCFAPAFMFLAIGVFSIFSSLAGGIFYQGQILSLGLLGLTVGAATGLAMSAERLGPARVSNWLWWVSVIIIVGAVLEVLGPLRPISDAVRAMLYSENIIYDSSERDLSVTGFIRPKLFTSEPSHLGKFLTIFLVVSATSTKKRIKHICAAFVGFFIISSPVVLLGVIIPSLLIARDYGFKRLTSSPTMIGGMLLLGLVVIYVMGDIAYNRLGMFGGTVEPSAYLRVIRPLYILQEAMLTRPFFGYGIGAEESLEDITLHATLAGPYVRYVIESFSRSQFTYGSSLFTVILSFGWIGAIFWVWALELLRRTFGGDPLAFWTFWIGYGFFQGTINTPLNLAPVFLLATAYVAPASRRLSRGSASASGRSVTERVGPARPELSPVLPRRLESGANGRKS